jgi:hypothetical protein
MHHLSGIAKSHRLSLLLYVAAALVLLNALSTVSVWLVKTRIMPPLEILSRGQE